VAIAVANHHHARHDTDTIRASGPANAKTARVIFSVAIAQQLAICQNAQNVKGGTA